MSYLVESNAFKMQLLNAQYKYIDNAEIIFNRIPDFDDTYGESDEGIKIYEAKQQIDSLLNSEL